MLVKIRGTEIVESSLFGNFGLLHVSAVKVNAQAQITSDSLM
jgi:hypothetical protein